MTSNAVPWPRLGNSFTQAVAHRLLALFGWRVEGALPDEPRFVIIVAPHTSNWDFPLGVVAMFAVGVRLSFLGKDSLFRFPLGPFMRLLGGEPVDRSNNQGIVEAAIERFRVRPRWVMALTPEGTRARVEQWKTGFQQIAVGAGVPIAPVAFDYQRRVVSLGTPFRPTGDSARDVAAVRALFRKEMARYPENFAE